MSMSDRLYSNPGRVPGSDTRATFRAAARPSRGKFLVVWWAACASGSLCRSFIDKPATENPSCDEATWGKKCCQPPLDPEAFGTHLLVHVLPVSIALSGCFQQKFCVEKTLPSVAMATPMPALSYEAVRMFFLCPLLFIQPLTALRASPSSVSQSCGTVLPFRVL